MSERKTERVREKETERERDRDRERDHGCIRSSRHRNRWSGIRSSDTNTTTPSSVVKELLNRRFSGVIAVTKRTDNNTHGGVKHFIDRLSLVVNL